jgi:hypothetical protein
LAFRSRWASWPKRRCFFLPAKIPALTATRKFLAIGLYAFVMTFAVINSLRMASLIAADQAAVRADRQTVGVQAAGRDLRRPDRTRQGMPRQAGEVTSL